VGLFFQEKNNPRRTTSHNLQKWPILLPYARPPHGFFWQYLSQKSSYKTSARTQLGVRIRRILLSRAVPYLSPPFASAQASLRQNRRPDDEGRNGSRRDDEGSGGATTKAETVARQQRERQRDDEGSGSALTKAEPVARRGRQKRWRDDEGSGGVTTKAAAARQSATA
jgi:hypothetical protein